MILKKMNYEIRKLLELEARVINCGLGKIDIRPLAAEIGLNIDYVMKMIIKICKRSSYNVGSHVFCTKENIIPEYERVGSLKMDFDHVKGLRKILAVDSGIIDDY